MKKGFTLIELLAVIVILAIIAVIATPIVLNIINDTKDNSNKRSIDMYKKAVENAVATYTLSFPEDNNIKAYKLYKKYNGKKDFIEYDGGNIDCDTQIYSTGEVYITNCTIDGKEVLASDSTKENKKYYSVGKETIEAHIGEYVNYVATGTSYTGKWRILGVEDGKVMLLSDYADTLTLQGIDGWTNGVERLHNMCSIYAGGTKAESARSVTVEDINKITGYNPYKTGNGKIAREGEPGEYANEVTYFYRDGIIYYQGTNGVEGTRTDKVINKFDSIDGINISSTNPNNTVSLNSNYYYYYLITLIDDSKGDVLGLAEDSNAYKMLVASWNNANATNHYWLANQDILTNESRTSWQMRKVWGGFVNASTLYHSFDAEDAETPQTSNVRAVVTLDESAKLVFDETNNIWNIE